MAQKCRFLAQTQSHQCHRTLPPVHTVPTQKGQDSAGEKGRCSAMHSYLKVQSARCTGGTAVGAASASNETHHGDATLHQVQHHLRKAKPEPRHLHVRHTCVVHHQSVSPISYPPVYCKLHNNRPFPIENHSEQGQSAESPLKTRGKVQILGDYYAIRSISHPQRVRGPSLSLQARRFRWETEPHGVFQACKYARMSSRNRGKAPASTCEHTHTRLLQISFCLIPSLS